MEKQIIFRILGIAETRDEAAIRSAYLNLLRSTNPEDDPEGFKRLREAYEGALSLAREPIPQEEEKEKTDIERWIDRVDHVYSDIHRRILPKNWEELLSDPLCDDLDTSLETREALLVYLMSHIYLPHTIWLMIDETFQIVADQTNLANQFPKNYLHYIVYYIQNEEFINYDLFRTEDAAADADSYIRAYLDLKRQIDQEQTDEEDKRQEWLKAWDDLKGYGVYHPYQDCEWIRVMVQKPKDGAADPARSQSKSGEQTTNAEQPGQADGSEQSRQANDSKPSEQADSRLLKATADRLLADYPDDNYVLYYCGEAYWHIGCHDKAYEIWSGVLKTYPTHYMAKRSSIPYLIEKNDLRQAKEYLMDLLDIDGNDEELLDQMHAVNDSLIREYTDMIADPAQADSKLANTLELGWCLFQNERLKEAVSLLSTFIPDAEQEYSYENLFGRVLYRAEDYEASLPHLLRWLELIYDTVDDGTDEMKKRISRRFRALHIISGCYHELDNHQQALSYVDEAISAADNQGDKLSAMQYKAYLLYQYQEYERCIDTCDQVIAEDPEYYPAYLQRLESAYRLQKGQQVVDDFYQAISIFAGYYKPYLLAAKVFFHHNQYEDAKGVLKRARDNGISFTPCMKLYEVKILRNLAKNQDDRKEPFAILDELDRLVEEHQKEESQNKEASSDKRGHDDNDGGFDIEDTSEVEFERGLLYWDNHVYDMAIRHLTNAIEQNPDRRQYRLVRGHIYLDSEKYKQALDDYAAAEEDFDSSPSFHYSKAECYEALGMKELARESLEKTLEADDSFRDACWKLSVYYKDRYTSQCDPGDFKKAEEYLNRQLAVQENCYYLVERGRLYMASFDLDLAIADFEKALEYAPDDWAAYNNLGCCYKYLKQFDKAIKCLESAVTFLGNEKNVLPYSNMADCYEALGDYPKAIECYEKDLSMFPHQSFLFEELGLLHSYLGHYDKALEYLNQAPDREDYCENVALIYYLMGNKSKALRFYSRRISAATDRNVKANLCYSLGTFLSDYLEDLPRALSYLKRSVQLSSDENKLFDVEWRIAITLYRMGKREDARIHAQQAIGHFQKTSYSSMENYLNYRQYRPARLMRDGWLKICLGETEQGLAAIRQMTECCRCRMCRQGECFESYLFLGWYYESEGDYRTALEMYEHSAAVNTHEQDIQIAVRRAQRLARGKRR